ncbi:uncharacterized protein FA14DRAFT_158148 [Meira miltonrushii]|uniref:Uncharacterized protein n=1 Tax=Meira miltonrushii TaxID=1280837 RepID=A0A316V3T9_9BASI|nr:uncharacterized protein FA14DRAFT_158148 [Meira miltonrushii]PWN32216.1 hypothetical protein FA14DRAFT_158148 [Meira miltonrushii]
MILKLFHLFFFLIYAVHGGFLQTKNVKKETPRQITLSPAQAHQHAFNEIASGSPVQSQYNKHANGVYVKSKVNPTRSHNKKMKAKLKPKLEIHENNIDQLYTLRHNGGTIDLGRSASGKRYEYSNASPFSKSRDSSP